MRHGPAEDRGPSGGDFDRRLTAAGRALVARVAEEVARTRGSPLSRFVASPLVRAQETARIARDRLTGSDAPVELIETHATLADYEPAWDLARQLIADGIDTLLVGHQPTVEAMVRGLLAGTGQPLRLQRGFATATVVAIRFDGGGRASGLASVIEPG